MRTARQLAILLASGIMLTSGCGGDEPGAISGTLIGDKYVPDALGGYPGCPISGAMISIPGTNHFTFSNEDGKYRIEDVPAGTYVLQVKLIYLTVAETEVEVVSGRRTYLPAMEISLPSFFVGGWGEVGFYDETDGSIRDVYVHMESNPRVTKTIRGELYPIGNDGVYLDDTITLTLDVNPADPIDADPDEPIVDPIDPVPVELTKNMFSYRLKTTLNIGKTTVLIKATNPDGGVQTRILTLYYYPSGLVASLKWAGEADLDLHLTGPDGTDCYFGAVHPDWGVTADDDQKRDEETTFDDPRFHYDRRSGWTFGGETIVLQFPPPGDYVITVLYYSSGYPSRKEEPVKPSVTVYVDGKMYEFAADRLMHVDDVWRVTSFHYPAAP